MISPTPGAPAPLKDEGNPAANALQTGLGDAGNGSRNGAALLPRVDFESCRSTRNEDDVDRRIGRRHFQEAWE